MLDKETEKEIFSLVEQSVEDENFRKYAIDLRSILHNGSVDFIRLVIYGRDNNNFIKEMDLIVKVIETKSAVRMGIIRSLRRAFRREIFIYQKLFPMMEQFQRQKYAEYPFERTLLVCYRTIETEDGKLAIMFNDLKKLHFTHLNPRKPMSINNMKFVLTQYARFHAVCFALRDQRNGLFEEELQKFDRIDKDTFTEETIINMIESGITTTIKTLTDTNQLELRQKFVNFTERGISRILEDVLSNIPEEWVIIHGDGWNENFVFQHKDDKKEIPSELCIFNWQFSTIHSPVLDLALFLYFVSSKEELLQFDELVRFYHEHLCLVLSSLGSDPKQLFPFSTVIDHWKKFSSYALLLVATGLPGICARQPETMSLLPDEDLYKERISAVIEHYFRTIEG
ncbi:unnamed protein product [Phaedon cochleariae]|uniref:CHK kinase-like domain-containing protein n=1 Tax=Phaedon cochleariae TaxID=80249 RepID=A0A9N9X094_PHACE|nr:unnamed protein product [Phaedon cochleariae]